jgi:hypothetical protein
VAIGPDDKKPIVKTKKEIIFMIISGDIWVINVEKVV